MIRLWLSAVLAITRVMPPLWAQAVPPCRTIPVERSDVAEVSSVAMDQISYVDEPIEQLKKMVPGLNPIELKAGDDSADTSAGTPSQDNKDFVLNKAGAAITELRRRIPNLVATEEVTEPILIPHHKGNDTRIFSYRIVHRQTPSGGDSLDEFRTDVRDQPVDYSVKSASRPLGVGFATMWLFFLPGNLHESRFRYLGQQSIGRRKTYVMAFAQIPGNTGLGAEIEFSSGHCSTPLQGVAWIDQSTFQIVRMQTDLLSSLPDIELYELRSVLTYHSVKITGLNLLLWLPSEVETRWQTAFRAGEESHRYMHYRLFQSTVKILPGFKNSSK